MAVDTLRLNRNRNSDQPLLIAVRFPHVEGDQPPVEVARDFVESFQVTVIARSAWTAQLVLFDRTGESILGLVSQAGFGRLIQLQWGWDDGYGIDRYPLFTGQWLTFLPEFTAEGVRITFDIVARDVPEQTLIKKARTFHLSVDGGGAHVSEIVRFIAQERGWETTDQTGRDTIQVTPDARLTEPLIQEARESDYKFIRERVLKRASGSRGGPFYFYVDAQNVVHFHQENFLKPRFPQVRYRFGQDAMGSVIEFAPGDLRFFSITLGGGGAIYRGADSLTGQQLRLAATDIGGLPDTLEHVEAGSDHLTPVLPPEETNQPEPPVSAVQGVMARTEADFKQKVRAKFERLRRLPYPATLTVRGTHAVIPMTLLTVEYLTPVKQLSHFLSGEFRVFGIEHEVGFSGWQTRFELFRVGVAPAPHTQKIENALKEGGVGPLVDEGPEQSADARRATPKVTREVQATPDI